VVQVVVDVVVEVVVESSVDASLYVGVDIIADIVVGIGTKVGVDVGVAIVIRYLNEFQDMVQVLFPVTVKSFFFMVYICHGYNRKRLVLDCSRFYSREELFRISRDQHKGQPLSLEYTSGLYQPLSCDVELRLACSMVEAYIASHQSDDDLAEHRRCQMDAIHTSSFEAKIRRKPRAQCGGQVDDGKNKKHSTVDIAPTEDAYDKANV
jgi:hypothetical protein